LLEWSDAALHYQDPVRGFKQCYFDALDDTEKGIVKRFWSDVRFNGYEL